MNARTAILISFSLFLLLLEGASAPTEATEGASTRPGVIALLEGSPRFTHAEFDLDASDQVVRASTAGIPSATIMARGDVEGSEIMSDTFYRISSGKVVGVFAGGSAAQPYSTTIEVTSHATMTASRVVGSTVGACPACLLVSLTGDWSRALAWVYHQEWIDAVSISAYFPGSNLQGVTEAIDAIVDSGRPVFHANGNSLFDTGIRMSPVWNSAAISVAQVDEAGRYRDPGQPPGADLTTWGENSPVADWNGGIVTAWGTSLAAPWMAGKYAGSLAGAWAEGALYRESVGGLVRQAVVNPPSAPPLFLADGHLDGADVLPWLGSHATYQYGFVAPANVGRQSEPSFWIGHGVLVDAEWEATSVWMDHLPAQPAMGPGHEANRLQRQAAADASIAANEAWCLAGKLVAPALRCADHYVTHDDWYA